MAGRGQTKANNEGINMLARVMQERMHRIASAPAPMDFGEIQSDYSLLTNQFPIPIPNNDYMVCAKALKIKPGDHVLVVWVGSDPVIIDMIRNGKEVG